MERNFSAKILLKNLGNSLEVFEESVVILKANTIDDILEKVNTYINTLNGNNEDDKILELVSIIDYFEIKDEIKMKNNFLGIYSRYLDEEELQAYKL